MVGRPAFDFDRPESLDEAVAAARPDAVVNAAAWTAVDAAEAEEAAAHRANAEGPGRLARLCAEARAPLVHLSTDYVFDGRKGAPYAEGDAPNPLSAYGRTKLAGERAVLGAGEGRAAVVRTSWVFAPGGRNFVRTMLAAGASRPVLRVVADQRGCPTAAPDLADALAAFLADARDGGWSDARHGGLFHAAGGGEATWHALAAAVFEDAVALGRFAGPVPRVEAIATADYPTPAPRPPDGRLDCGRLARTLRVALPPWREGLRRVLAAMPPTAGASGERPSAGR